MQTWLAYIGQVIRGSLWFVPGLMTIAAAVLAVVSGRLDSAVDDFGPLSMLLFHGDPDATRTLLSTVAGSMITVAGVSYSVTMVAMSLASSQLGPRLLRNFRRDRGNQVVLGAFIATFLFCLMTMWAGTYRGFGPSLSASLALVMATGSLFLLIYFIHHIALSMQADYVITEVARELRQSLAVAFPEEQEQPAEAFDGSAREWALVPTRTNGYLQGVDEAHLARIARKHDLRFEVLRRPGQFLMEASPLVKVLGRSSMPDDLARSVQRGFIIGERRTADQDPEQGIHQLVEVAVRALSAGINDPFTAMTCIDRLSGELGRIAARPAQTRIRCDRDGHARVLLERTDFHGVVAAAFDQIREFSHDMPAVAIRLVEGFGRIAERASYRERRMLLVRQARLVLAACAGTMQEADLAVLRDRYAKLLASVDVDEQR
ncbi:MAG: DUF2254 domain-containing protein [Pseudomonadales bacterium]